MSTVGTKRINTLINSCFNLYYTIFTETSVCYSVQVAYSIGTLKKYGISSAGGISFITISLLAIVSAAFSLTFT